MTQVLQHLVSSNPIFSVAYGVAIIGSHCILGDVQMKTLLDKIKSFMIAESIKYTGAAILGGVVTGTVGTFAAIPAGLYIAYDIGSQWKAGAENNKESSGEHVNILPTQNLSAAAMDMIADLTVESIWGKICS